MWSDDEFRSGRPFSGLADGEPVVPLGEFSDGDTVFWRRADNRLSTWSPHDQYPGAAASDLTDFGVSLSEFARRINWDVPPPDTEVHRLAREGDLREIERFLAAGPPDRAPDPYYGPLVAIAGRYGWVDAVRACLAAGASERHALLGALNGGGSPSVLKVLLEELGLSPPRPAEMEALASDAVFDYLQQRELVSKGPR